MNMFLLYYSAALAASKVNKLIIIICPIEERSITMLRWRIYQPTPRGVASK